jgi:hypothetical protein
MNRPPDVELVLRDYFADDGGSAPDHVLDIVEDRIARLPRRHAWRLRGRPYMNRFAKLAIGIAAVLIVGVIGIALVLRPGGSNIGSQGPTAAPSPVATPTPAPTPSPSPAALKSGVKGPGTFTGQFATSPIPWTVTLPDGWSAYDTDIVMGPERAGKGAAIVTERAVNVPKNSCAPKGTVPATSAEQFLTAVEARKDWDVSDRTAATIGAYPATRIDIVLPADTSICGAGKDYMVVAHNDGTGFYSQGPSMHVTYWVADVNGEPLLVERFSFAETPASDLAQSDAVVDSIEITP